MSAPNPGFAWPPEGVRENLGAARRILKRQRRVRPDRQQVVEIEQHRRMLGGRNQHVDKTARDMRADHVAFERRRHRDRAGLGARDDKMVAPEMHQALEKRPFGGHRHVEARLQGPRMAWPEHLLEAALHRQAVASHGRHVRRHGRRPAIR
jgi:hypothetical protein